MSKKGKKNAQDDMKHLDLETVNAASSGDCTGLIPAAPRSDAQLESYEEVYDMDNSTVEPKPRADRKSGR